MSIVRIDIPESHTHGWQARAYVVKGLKLTRFISDSRKGKARGWHMALWHEHRLKAEARRLRLLQQPFWPRRPRPASP